MRNIGSARSLVIFLSVMSLLVSVSYAGTTGVTKSHKKKLTDKLRAELNASDSEASHPIVPTTEELKKVQEAEKAEEEKTSATIVQDEIGGEAAGTPVTEDKDKDKVDPNIPATTNPFLARFRSVLKRVLELLGLRRRKDGRKSRLLDLGNNDIDHVPVYQEEVRTTVGAVLGQRECIQKAACVSGSYLKGVHGKQLIFALLDVFSPTFWKDTVKIAKQSAIFNEGCNYKCLED